MKNYVIIRCISIDGIIDKKHICHVLYFRVSYCSLFLFSAFLPTLCPASLPGDCPGQFHLLLIILPCVRSMWFPPTYRLFSLLNNVQWVTSPRALKSLSSPHSLSVSLQPFVLCVPHVLCVPRASLVFISSGFCVSVFHHCLLLLFLLLGLCIFAFHVFLYLDISSLKLAFCFNLPAFTWLEFNTDNIRKNKNNCTLHSRFGCFFATWHFEKKSMFDTIYKSLQIAMPTGSKSLTRLVSCSYMRIKTSLSTRNREK